MFVDKQYCFGKQMVFGCEFSHTEVFLCGRKCFLGHVVEMPNVGLELAVFFNLCTIASQCLKRIEYIDIIFRYSFIYLNVPIS